MRGGARRVVLTGLGALSCVGSGKESFWRGALDGRSGIKPLTRFDASAFSCRIAGQIDDFDPLRYMDSKIAKRTERFTQFSLAAARMAIEDAGLDLEGVDRDRLGVYLGSAIAGLGFAEEQCENLLQRGVKGVRPTLAISVYGGAAANNVALVFGANGPNLGNGNSCASGAIAIGEAARLVARGDADIMIAGGVDTPLTRLTFSAFHLLRAMSTRNDDPATACRPFDKHRDGFVMAEGAGIVVLEDYESARRRGAHVYAELLGYANTNDAHSMTSPRADAAQTSRCMRMALQDAACPVESLGYINAHGSSTPLNDSCESRAIRMVIGDARVPVSSTKSAHGHALGASGAMELILSALALQEGVLPPSHNVFEPDGACDLDLIVDEPRQRRVERVLSNSFGFGGINACVVLGRA